MIGCQAARRSRVALITGEEKILPPNPVLFRLHRRIDAARSAVEFLAVDEIQLCADPERGHVFTARLLHARGLIETMFLGAETIRPLMRRLVRSRVYQPAALLDADLYRAQEVTRLPRRSAVVAFSLADVFSLGRTGAARQRGGTAVVLGAL